MEFGLEVNRFLYLRMRLIRRTVLITTLSKLVSFTDLNLERKTSTAGATTVQLPQFKLQVFRQLLYQ